MATGTESKIAEALFERLRTATITPTLTVQWPEVDFVPPADTGYIRVNWPMPVRPRRLWLGESSYNRHVGIFQVDVVWPTGRGLMDAREVADQVAARFKRDTEIEVVAGSLSIEIRDPPVVERPVSGQSGWSATPVSIRYTCDMPNS